MIRYIFLLTTCLVLTTLIVLINLLPNPPLIDANKVSFSEPADATNHLIFTNVNVFNGQESIHQQTVVVTNGIIESVGDSAAFTAKSDLEYLHVDGDGLTLIPGIIDAHTHTYGNGLSDALRFGVTTHLDMFGMENTLQSTKRIREEFAYTSQSDLFSAGTLATVKGGHGTQFGFAIDTIDSFEEIAAWVDLRKQAGSDYIKLVYMPNQTFMPSLSREWAKELISQSHAQGMMVVAHISSHQAAQEIIEDGIDGLVHIFADQLVSDELLALSKQRNIFIIPTLAVIASANGMALGEAIAKQAPSAPLLSVQQKSTLQANYGATIPGFEYDIAMQNVARFFAAGVTILSGSDAPNPGTAYGISALHEITLLVKAGLSPAQALASATAEPARIFKLSGRGVIEKGVRADLVLLSGDPLANINALYNIKAVYKNGFPINRELSAQNMSGRAIESTVLGNFTITPSIENGLATLEDFTWNVSDDRMANGKSISKIEVLEMTNSVDATNNNNGVLKITATVNTGFPYPWAGAAVGDFSLPIVGKDISAFKYLKFDAKGTLGSYRVLSFDTAFSGVPPSQTFELSEDWQTMTLSLKSFSGLNTQVFSGFAFVAGPSAGEFTFYLDNIRLE